MDKPLHILLVDDEPLILRALSSILLANGHRVEDAQDSIAAIEVLEASASINVVIVDFMLQDAVDGVELVSMLRERRPSLPVILTSGLPQESMESFVSRIPGCQFLKKPFGRASVISALRSLKIQ